MALLQQKALANYEEQQGKNGITRSFIRLADVYQPLSRTSYGISSHPHRKRRMRWTSCI